MAVVHATAAHAPLLVGVAILSTLVLFGAVVPAVILNWGRRGR